MTQRQTSRVIESRQVRRRKDWKPKLISSFRVIHDIKEQRNPNASRNISPFQVVGSRPPRYCSKKLDLVGAAQVRGEPKFEGGKVLDRMNERLASETPSLTLHPTKGFRELSVKRDAAAAVTAELKRGETNLHPKAIRHAMRNYGADIKEPKRVEK